MIEMIYDTEKTQMKTIINSKNVIQNFIYKLRHDQNVKKFLENVIYNIENYSSLEHMEQ